jgi:hypothetical protein
MQDELKRWRPERVVVVIYANNDFGDMFRNRLFRVDGDFLERYFSRKPNLAQKLLDRLATETFLGRAAGAVGRRVWPPPDILTDPNRYFDFLLERCRREYLNYVDPAGIVLSGDHYDADLALMPGAESSQLKIRLMRAVLAELWATMPSGSLFVILPAKVDVEPTAAQLDYPSYRAENLSSAMAEALDTIGATYVNLFGRLGLMHYRSQDGHWNAAGQALAASIVAEALNEAYARSVR